MSKQIIKGSLSATEAKTMVVYGARPIVPMETDEIIDNAVCLATAELRQKCIDTAPTIKKEDSPDKGKKMPIFQYPFLVKQGEVERKITVRTNDTDVVNGDSYSIVCQEYTDKNGKEVKFATIL